MGKITGQPVYNLLGGKAYKKLLVPQVISIKEPKEMAEDALRFVNAGFRSIKIKVGADDWQKDVERIKHVRKAIGDTQMRVDVNQGWKDRATSMPVSYTHLDVYKRQPGNGCFHNLFLLHSNG